MASRNAPDLSEFKRASFGGLNAAQIVTLIATVQGEIGISTSPALVPLSVIEAMGWDGAVYLGEQAATTPAKSPELYYVRHPDPAIKAEVEEWLWPILPRLLPTILRAFAWGAIPYAMTWKVEDLKITVQRGGGKPRAQTIKDFAHYVKVHEIWPGDVDIELSDDGEDLVSLKALGKEYGENRAYVSVWDRAFGRWTGQGSRRRAYRPWYKSAMIELWQARYLERSVDAARIVRVPKGTTEINGKNVRTEVIGARAIMALKNGGATALSSERDENGNLLWEVELLEVPDRSDVWHKALDRLDAQKVLAAMVPPAAIGLEDATFAGARIPAQLFVEFAQQIAAFAAHELTAVVEAVHRFNHKADVPAPEILAYDLPQAKRKLLAEVFKAVSTQQRELDDGRVYTLGELVDDEIVDQLGIPKRPVAEAARERREPPPMGDAAPPGKEKDMTSEREKRREAAREVEGEDATGAKGEGVDG